MGVSSDVWEVFGKCLGGVWVMFGKCLGSDWEGGEAHLFARRCAPVAA